MSYHHFSVEERERIYGWRLEGRSLAEIAGLMRRNKSSIGRELRRNCSLEGIYLPSSAQNMATERRKAASSHRKEWSEESLNEIKTRLSFHESPDQISHRMQRESKEAPSHETIYRMIYEDRDGMGEYSSKLRRKIKRRRARNQKKPLRGKIPNRVGIEERPPTITKGHWEGDTMIGKNHQGAIATFADRVSRFVFAWLLSNKTAPVLNQSVRALFEAGHLLNTLTFDNGLEFARHQELTEELGVSCFFADPYCSWQRGLNEHSNGLLREFIPKKTDFRKLTNPQIQLYVRMINNRPRKCLGYLTPHEVHFEHSNCHSKVFSSNLNLYCSVALQI